MMRGWDRRCDNGVIGNFRGYLVDIFKFNDFTRLLKTYFTLHY